MRWCIHLIGCVSVITSTLAGCVAGSPPDVGIRYGNGFLTKRVFCEHPRSDASAVTHLAFIPAVHEKPPAVAVLNARACYREIDARTAGLRKSFRFDGSASKLSLVQIDSDPEPEILCGGGGFSNVALCDSDGKRLWTYEHSSGESPKAIGVDLDRDRDLEFYVTGRDGRLLARLDRAGQTTWETSVGRWPISIDYYFPLESEPGQIVLLLSGRRYRIQLRNPDGTFVREFGAPRDSWGGISVIRDWPGRKLRVLTAGRAIRMIDGSGKVLWEHSLEPTTGGAFELNHSLVHFANSEPYLAIVAAASSRFGRSNLCLFSLEGKLRYQEVIGVSDGILAIDDPNDTQAGQLLLVGDGVERVMAYRLAR